MVHQSLEELSHRWEFLSHDPVHVQTCISGAEGLDARGLAGQCREIMALRQEVQFFTARLLRTLNQLSLYRNMMFSSLGHYAVERLGMSRRTAYELVYLGRHFIELPELGEAFRRNELTQRQVFLIATVANKRPLARGSRTPERCLCWLFRPNMNGLRGSSRWMRISRGKPRWCQETHPGGT